MRKQHHFNRSTRTSAALSAILAATLVAALCSVSHADIVINEIMFNPYEPFGVTNDTEYVEIFNTGTTTVSLADYRFDNGIDFSFPPEATLASSNYLVICESVAAFTNAYPSVVNYVGEFGGSLRNSGERLTLSMRDASNNWVTVDTISYVDIGAADGDGPSLELVNPGFARLRNHCYGAWTPSTSTNGTPGAINDEYDAAPPPVVADAIHSPALPPAGSTVTITCRAAAYDSDVVGVTCKYRISANPAGTFKTATMEDLGLNGDAIANDGVYSVQLPPYGDDTFTEGTVLEFLVDVQDSYGKSLVAPGTNTTSNELGAPDGPYCYLLKFGEDSGYTGEYDTYHILMTEVNKSALETRGLQNDELLDATLITADGEIFYNCGVRFRGGSSRNANLGGYRVELPKSRKYESFSELSFNHLNALNQYIGLELARRAGYDVKSQKTELSRVWLNGINKTTVANHGIYIRIEGFDGHILERYYGEDDWGNRYKADGDGIYDGDLSYTSDLNAYINNNVSIYYNYMVNIENPPDVWTEMQDLCWTVNQTTNVLPSVMSNRVNVRAWARLYALQVCLANNESGWLCPYATRGDEVRLYAHPITGVFDLFPWDMDAMLEHNNAGVWLWNHNVTRNFLFQPPMSPYYIGDVLDILDGLMSNESMSEFWDEMGSALANKASVRTTWQNNLNALRTNLKNAISTNLTVNISNTVTSGDLATIVNASSVSLSGSFPQNYTFGVRVNGELAAFDSWDVASMQTTYGKWHTTNNLSLASGVNDVLVETLDEFGNVLQSKEITVVNTTTSVTNPVATISGNTTWDNSGGVIIVSGNQTISSGATLTVNPGTTILMNPGTQLAVTNGTLVLNATTPMNPIHILPSDGSSAWSIVSGDSGLVSASNTIFSGGTITARNLTLEDCEITDSSNAAGIIQLTATAGNPSLTMRRCVVEDATKVSLANTIGLIEDCLFANMSDTAIEQTGGNVQVITSTVEGPSGSSTADGIRASATAMLSVSNCLFTGIGDQAVLISGSGSSASVSESLIISSGTGLEAASSASIANINNTVAACTTAIKGSAQSVTNAILWNNTNAFSSGPATVHYSNVQQPGTNAYPGTANINRNPWFLNEAEADYRLAEQSPCLGTASDGGDMGASYPVGANPAAPSSLQLLNSAVGGTNRIVISWNDNSDDEYAFEIYRRIEEGDWALLETTAPGTTNYVDASVAANTTYSYRLRAEHNRGHSLYSNTGTIIASYDGYAATLAANLRITEIYYNPLGDNDLEEFIEIKNISPTETLDLSGLYTDNDRYVFPEGVTLSPTNFLVLARNSAAFNSAYGFAPDAQYLEDDKLSNGGETLWIKDSLGNDILRAEYNDTWYPTTDGDGYSLVPVDTNPTDGDPETSAYWRASTNPGGSPGADDPAPPYGNILINEVLSHTDEPDYDFIELYNSGTSTVDITGWYLSDTDDDLELYEIPSTTPIGPGNYYTFIENTSFNQNPDTPGNFEISSLGDEVYLSSSDGTNLTSYRVSVKFGAADNGFSFGRHVRSDGKSDFTTISSVTTNSTNASPLISPIVINEIMYNPTGGGNEFVELLNRTGSSQPLFDTANPTNTWHFNGAMEYTFPTNVTLAPNEHILITGIEPDVFRSTYAITNTIRIFGPFSGDLNNGGESVKLYFPDEPELSGFVPPILADRVKYEDNLPWPEAADNDGPSLERVNPSAYGNDPANWVAGTVGGTPGTVNNSAGLPAVAFDRVTSRVNESNGTVLVEVVLQPANTNVPVTVDYAVTGGTAAEGTDFDLASGTLLFWAHDTHKQIAVTLYDNGTGPELDKTVEISLANVSGGGLLGGNQTHTLTIRDTNGGTIAAPTFIPTETDFFGDISLVMTSTTPATVIYYTLDGSLPVLPLEDVTGGYEPSSSAHLYTGPVPLQTSTRIKAAAMVGSYGASTVSSILYLEQTPMYTYPEGTIISTMSAGTDDAEELSFPSRATNLTNTYIRLGKDDVAKWVYGGIRFTNVAVPADATISNAYIQFTSSDEGYGTVTHTIYGEASDNPSTFSGTSGNISTRSKTSASATWVPPSWTEANASGIAQRTADISSIIQELVNRPGWQSGNDIAIIIVYGAPASGDMRPAHSYDGNSVKAPYLLVKYDPEPSEDANGDGIPDTWQEQHFGDANDPDAEPDADPDGDHFSNADEYTAGTIPTNSSSLLAFTGVLISETDNTIRWLSVSNRTYDVYRTTNLLQGWDAQPFTSNIPGEASGINSVTDPSSETPVFYRINAVMPE